MKNRGRVKTDYYGRENLPKDGGYILYSNHQGKYDAIGILTDQKEPCSVLMERKQGSRIVAKQVLRLTGSETLDLDNPKSQITTLKKWQNRWQKEEDISSFRRKWGDNKNTLQKFNAGCFRCSFDSKTPVVPVAIVDSYKGLNGNSLRKVTTQVHYLKPIPYEEYKDLRKMNCVIL